MIKIIVDSTAYLDRAYAKEHDITVIPLRVLYREHEFEEGAPGEFDEFFEDFTKTKIFPKTSQPSVELFVEEFNKAIKKGDEVIVFTISSSLSGTYNAACLAKESCINPSRVTVYDSKNACQTIAGYVMDTVEMINEGKSVKEIVEHINKIQNTSKVAFIPDSLEYLAKGGRIGKVTATLGTILQLKPILGFKNGVLGCEKKSIGMQRAINDLISSIPEKIKRLFIIHVANTKFFEMLKQKVTEFLNKRQQKVQILISEVGPVVASHVGPAVGLSWTGLEA